MSFASLILLAGLIAQAPKQGKVEGVVTSEVTGQPVKKANVRLIGAGPNAPAGVSATTDATGRFHLDRVDPGKYSVWAECSGYGPNSGKGYIQVAEDQEIKDISISLMPLGLVSGRVLDEAGEPVMNASVVAFHYIYAEGRKQLEQSGLANTNDLGQFQMIDLPPGKYFFEVEVSRVRVLPERTVSTIPAEAYPPTYYPNGTSFEQAAAQEVKPGVELGNLDFHLKPEPAFHVSGRVAGVPPDAVTNQVNLRLDRPGVRWGGQSGAQVQLQAGGAFDIRDVVKGEYVLLAMRLESGNTLFARQTLNVAGKDIEGIVLSPAPGSSIRGVVEVEGAPAVTPPVPPAGLKGYPGQNFVVLEGVGAFRFGGRPFPVKDGSFLIQGIMPDVYVVKMQGAPARAYMKSVQLDGQDLADARIDLTNPVTGELRIVLGTDPGQIRGSVQTRSGQPAASVTVTAAPPADRASFPGLLQSTTTDQNGNFQFQNAAPGDYRIVAWETQDGFPVLDLEFQKLFESNAVKVTLQPNGNESIQAVAIPLAEMQAAKEKMP